VFLFVAMVTQVVARCRGFVLVGLGKPHLESRMGHGIFGGRFGRSLKMPLRNLGDAMSRCRNSVVAVEVGH
jgi:hypothetical protein